MSENKLLNNEIILDPYQHKDYLILVLVARHEFICSVRKILNIKKKYKDKYGFFLRICREKELKRAKKELHQQKILLDDLERALDVIESNGNMERALSDAEYKDDIRYERIIKDRVENVENTSEKGVLIEISKQLTEFHYLIHKIVNQNKRKSEWKIQEPFSISEKFKR